MFAKYSSEVPTVWIIEYIQMNTTYRLFHHFYKLKWTNFHALEQVVNEALNDDNILWIDALISFKQVQEVTIQKKGSTVFLKNCLNLIITLVRS